MSAHEPRRLLAYGGELRGLVRDALDAERADEPADPARLRGIEQKIAAQIGAAAAVSAPQPAPAPRPAPAPPAPTSAWLGGKAAWLALASLAVVGALALSLSRTDSVAPAPVPTTPRAPSAFVPEKKPLSFAGSASESANVPTLSPADLPSAPPSASSPRSAARAALDPSPSPAVTDGEEIALLARAHDALHGRPAESLELCREHQARFASGHFAQEREAVAIEALVYLNRRTEAAARWNEFKTRYPTSSHRVHLDSLFSPASAPAAP